MKEISMAKQQPRIRDCIYYEKGKKCMKKIMEPVYGKVPKLTEVCPFIPTERIEACKESEMPR